MPYRKPKHKNAVPRVVLLGLAVLLDHCWIHSMLDFRTSQVALTEIRGHICSQIRTPEVCCILANWFPALIL